MRGATCGRCIQKDGQHDISIHAPHARSDDVGARLDRCMKISIHAPHARSDELQPEGIAEFLKISIHAPHARSDLVWTLHKRLLTFQSTLLMRGATVAATAAVRGPRYFNPRSSCEERLCRSCSVSASTAFQSTLLMRGATADIIPAYRDIVFQSTLLMRGATCSKSTCAAQRWIFQSTLLMRGATVTSVPVDCTLDDISIHAPHARSDSSISW